MQNSVMRIIMGLVTEPYGARIGNVQAGEEESEGNIITLLKYLKCCNLEEGKFPVSVNSGGQDLK